MQRIWEIVRFYLPLSLTAFGGPQAHIALYHQIFVEAQGWLNAEVFAELFAISQTLPGRFQLTKGLDRLNWDMLLHYCEGDL
jgi:chromate transporter